MNKDKFNDIDSSLFETNDVDKLADLEDGIYYVYATLYDDKGRKRSKTKKILIEIDATLNLAAPNPQYLSVEELTVDNFFQGVEVVICDRIPEVRGTTYFGSQVIATWRSLVLTSSLIADSDVGEFSIKSPKPLELGSHTVTLYAVTPDGVRSPDLTVPFEITGESHCHAAASILPVDEAYNYIWLILAGVFTFFFFIILFWKKRDKKEIIALKLEKIGYTRAKDSKKRKLKTIAKEKIFTKEDTLEDLRKFLEFARWRAKEEKKEKNEKILNWVENWSDWRNFKKWKNDKKKDK